MRSDTALRSVRTATDLHVPAQRRRLQIDGTTLAFVDCGEARAEPIVLLHGYLGSHLSWRHLVPALSAAHRVIALDWFGWGDSGRRLDLRYDYDSEVDRLGRVLDAFGLATCNLFGLDYGGFLALGLCQRDPQRVLRLALLASRAHATFTFKWATIFRLISIGGRLPVVRSLIARLPHTAIHRRGAARELRRGVFDEFCFEHYAGWMSKDPDGGRFLTHFFAHYRVRPRSDLARGLARMTCPTAIIWGRNDPFLPLAVATELAAKIPAARLTMLENTGHYVTEERPQEVQRALTDLLDRPVH